MEKTEEQALLEREEIPNEEIEVTGVKIVIIPGKSPYRIAFILGSIFGLIFGIGQIFLANITVGVIVEASQISFMLGLSALVWGLGTLAVGVIGGRQSGRVSTGLFASIWAAVLSGLIIFVARYIISVQRTSALNDAYLPPSAEFIKVIAITSIVIWFCIIVTGAMLGSLGGLLGRNLSLNTVTEEYVLVDDNEEGLDEEQALAENKVGIDEGVAIAQAPVGSDVDLDEEEAAELEDVTSEEEAKKEEPGVAAKGQTPVSTAEDIARE